MAIDVQGGSDEYPLMPPKICGEFSQLEVSPFLRHDLSRNGGGLSNVLRSAGELFGREIAQRTVRVVGVILRARPLPVRVDPREI